MSRRRSMLAVSLLLLVSTLFAYSAVRDHSFVMYDDPSYVLENPHVSRGITWAGVKWAFTRSHSDNWHPMTWLSHMLDCEVFGLDPGPHHIVSVGLHGLSAIVLFLALQTMTRAVWPSAFVAALFAIHPLRVESVAWIAERKDVLSGLFWMLTIAAYARYTKRSCFGTYVWVLVCLTLGLMSKPMLVTLPVVLLFLDVWPLGRTRLTAPAEGTLRVRSLILEKAPLFALALASCAVTLVSQAGGRAVATLESVSVGWRVVNALTSYGWYALRTVWPTDLAVFYPHPGLLASASLSSAAIPAAAAALWMTIVTLVSLRWVRRWPWITTGWFWYLTTLLPVIGLIQVGGQARADRYAYLPTVGVYLIVAWGAGELARRWTWVRFALIPAAVLVLITSMIVARQQVAYWHDDRTLFERALAVTDDNFVAHNNLGALAKRSGDLEEAARHYEEAVRLQANHAVYLNNLGGVRAQQGRLDEAGVLFERALLLDADDPNVQSNFGSLLLVRGELDRAIEHLEQAVRLDPDHHRARGNLGAAFKLKGDLSRAALHLGRALELNPGYAAAHLNMGHVASAQGEDRKALTHYRQTIQLDSRQLQASTELAWLLATSRDATVRNGREALHWASHVAERKSMETELLELLAAAHAEAGEFDLAVDWQLRALDTVDVDRRRELRAQLEDYRAGLPRRDRPPR